MLGVLTGVPGVGATTVAEEALEEINFEVVNFGTVMLEVAKEEGLVEKRDEIRKLPQEKQRDIQEKAGKEIADRSEEGKDFLVDTHCTVNTPEGYLPGLPEWVLRPLEPDVIILVEADPDEILFRRLEDIEERERDIEGTKEIDQHQKVNRSAAMSYATLTGSTVKIIENHDDQLEKAVEEMINLFE